MDSLTTHPSTAQQAKAFTSPASLSYPGGTGDMTPPSSEKDGQHQADGKMNGQQDATQQTGNGVTPNTPAATPRAGVGNSGLIPTLQNIVATVNLDCRLDLKTIALHARNAEYNPKRFAAVIMRIRDPKTTALIFASGKMVVTGAKSEDDSKLASRKYARIIQKLGFNAKFTDFKIQNIVGSCDIKFPIRLEGLASKHHMFSSYEPELFPGLIYRMIKPKIVLLIFVSGKIVLTGAKVREEIYQAFEAIFPTLQGAGVFGLSTTLALLQRARYASTKITIVDAAAEIPNEYGSSVDSSRIVRPDYSDPVYTRLADEAQVFWRDQTPSGYGGQGRYAEPGFLLTVDNEQTSAYVKKAYENVTTVAAGSRGPGDVELLEGEDKIRRASGYEHLKALWGYVNRRSGWADAGKTVDFMRRKVDELGAGRVTFRLGVQVDRLTVGVDGAGKKAVTGVQLAGGGERLAADLTVVAAGAWSASLVDLGGRAVATGQVMTYVQITQQEEDAMRDRPTIMNMSRGLFIIPPRQRLLKVARHGFGYRNPTAVPTRNILGYEGAEQEIHVSLPLNGMEAPKEGQDFCRAEMRDLLPHMADRPFVKTRVCWYSDTPTGNFIIDRVPGYEGVLVATGGSGHGFKFAPVIGDKIVDRIEGRLDPELQHCWRWRESVGEFDGCDDGSRSGRRGMIAQDELARGSRYRRRIGPMVWASCLFGFSLALYGSYYYTTYSQALKVAAHLDLPQNADVSDRWRDRTRDFDEEVDVSEKFLLLKAKRRRLVQRASGNVLEVSCGTGRNMELYDLRPYDVDEKAGYGRSRNTRITSITFNDQSDVMIERAEAKFDAIEASRPEAQRFNGRVSFLVGDAGIKGVVPRPPHGYDTIVQTMGLCSIADAPAFLRRLGQLCRQPDERGDNDKDEDGAIDDARRGGKILLLEHGRSHYTWLNRLLDNGAKMHANHYGCWWNKDVDEIVRQSGLVVDRVRRYNFGTT
ncbi:hypothetical protein DV735_g3614, partial [Chaetothyriales sp. CBS 134920]